MITKSWTTIDKSEWPSGPWQSEPDKLQWADETTGLPCLIKRNNAGALCGYVGVPENHPWYGLGYSDIEPYPDVHGDLTYADHCQDGPEAQTICHVPEPGEPDNVWWLGFDCAHAGDVMPAYAERFSFPSFPGDSYKTVDYVRAECASLALATLHATTNGQTR